MKKIVIVLLFVVSITNAQKKIPFIDVAEIELQLEKSSKENNYTKALALINKINKNDSLYFSYLSSKSYYLLQLKKYDDVVKVADEGINANHQKPKVFFYTNKGIALTNLKKYDEAINTYNKALKIYPKNYLLWFNKGIVLETQGKINEALESYKETIKLNPLFRSPHLQIGNIFYKQDRLAQSLMAYNMYVLLNPKAPRVFSTIKELNTKVAAVNSNTRNEDLKLFDADNSFNELDSILKSKIAIKESYQTNVDISMALVNQNHIMLQKLNGFEGKGSFWDDKYVPFYNWILESNQFDKFIYTLLLSTQNIEHQKIIANNTEKIASFYDLLKGKWIQIVSKNIVNVNGENQVLYSEYIEGTVNAIGKRNGKKINRFLGFLQ